MGYPVMIGPLTRTKNLWSSEEDRKLIVGLNRHYESLNRWKLIANDEELEFKGKRSNVDIKDRLRFLCHSLTVISSFFVPMHCAEPNIFIPREYFYVFEGNGNDGPNITLLPVEERTALDPLVAKISRRSKEFLDFYKSIPEALADDPIRKVLTWDQICIKCFTRSHALSVENRIDLLKSLVENGHLNYKRIGVRTYVWRTSA